MKKLALCLAALLAAGSFAAAVAMAGGGDCAGSKRSTAEIVYPADEGDKS